MALAHLNNHKLQSRKLIERIMVNFILSQTSSVILPCKVMRYKIVNIWLLYPEAINVCLFFLFPNICSLSWLRARTYAVKLKTKMEFRHFLIDTEQHDHLRTKSRWMIVCENTIFKCWKKGIYCAHSNSLILIFAFRWASSPTYFLNLT